MKTRYWVTILVIVSIVVAGIVFFVSDSSPHPFSSWGKHRATNQVNQYEIFRDLLVIFLTLLGLGGLIVFTWVSKGLQVVVKKKVGEEVDHAMATFFLELSYDCWEAYEVKGEFKKDKRDQLEKAIRLSKKALKRAQRLDTEQKQFKKILCSIKNSVAYHLAIRDCDKDAPKAISLAKYAYNERNDFDFEVSCHWMETYGFVLIRMGNKEQRAEGRSIIKDLRDRKYLPRTTMDTIEGKYTKNLAVRVVWI